MGLYFQVPNVARIKNGGGDKAPKVQIFIKSSGKFSPRISFIPFLSLSSPFILSLPLSFPVFSPFSSFDGPGRVWNAAGFAAAWRCL